MIRLEEIITDIGQITPEWLTEKLSAKGYLDRGKAVAVNLVSATERFVSTSYYLEITYLNADLEKVPSKLFAKIYKPDLNWELIGNKEAEFYNLFPGIMPKIPIIPCYAAGYSQQTQRAYVLMKDVTASHYNLLGERSLAESNLVQVIESLAKLHSYWWDHPRLGKGIGDFPARNSFQNYMADLEQRFEVFNQAPDLVITSEKVAIYHEILHSWEKMFTRLDRKRNITLIHGDANPLGNVLYPKSPEHDQLYLIDWNDWQIDLGARDVAYAIMFNYFPAERVKFEERILRRYHDLLLEAGIKNYPWSEFWDDYRLSVIANLFIPIIWYSWKVPQQFWWPRYVKSLLNFESLGCRELLA